MKFSFHGTQTLWQNNNHVLFPKINWDMIAAGYYAVVNPAPGGQAILYISQREMNKMVRVALSQDTSLIILASPGDTPPTLDQSSTSSPFKYQNTPRVGPLDPTGWVDGKNWAVSNLHKFCEISESGNVSVPLTEETLSGLLPYWGHMASFRTGGPLTTTKTLKVDLWSITKEYIRLLKHHGPQYVILRMKTTLFLMYRRLAAQPGQHAWLLGTPVGLAQCGLPKIIPANLRAGVLRGDLRTIRILGTLFSGYKVFEGTHKISDLSSVLGPHPFLDEGIFEEFKSFCEKDFWRIVGKYERGKNSSLLSPNFAMSHDSERFIPLTAGPNHKVGILGAAQDAIAWDSNPINWPLEWANAVGDTDTIALFNKTLKKAKLGVPGGITYHTGRIQLLPEPAGKVRSIAIVDYWTQRVMHPVHKWMMDVLRVLPGDATFDQEGALGSFANIYGKNTCYSIDLKSATDMIPQDCYLAVLRPVLGEKLSNIWMCLMTDRWFHIPKPKKPRDGEGGNKRKSLFHSSLWGKDVQYNRGQPMGTLSSWASMALVHHAIELFSAKKAGIDPFTFQEYRILGDDNVTANSLVANMYLQVTEGLRIPTSPAKTLVGDAFCFASQYFFKGVNISPQSMKEDIGIVKAPQRVEFAMRALRRGWCSQGTTGFSLSSFLRSLLQQQDYISSVKEWNKGRLGKYAQMALIVSLATSISVLDRLGYQDTGCETLLLALANRVEALGGNQGQMGKGFEEPLVELNVQFALSVIRMITDETKHACESLTNSAQYWVEWWRGMENTSFLPRSSRLGQNWTTLPNIPYEEDKFVQIKARTRVVDTDAGCIRYQDPKFMTMYFPDIFFSREFTLRTGMKFRPRSTRYKIEYKEALKRLQLLHQAMWPVLQEVWTPMFGSPAMDLEAYPFWDGKGWGFAPAKWKSITYDAAEKLNTIMDRLLSLETSDRASTIVEAWRGVGEALDVFSSIPRAPNFHSIEDLVPDKRPDAKEFGAEWVRRTQAIHNVLKTWPLDNIKGMFGKDRIILQNSKDKLGT